MLIEDGGLTLSIKNLSDKIFELGSTVVRQKDEKPVHFRYVEDVKYAINLHNTKRIQIIDVIPQYILDIIGSGVVIVPGPEVDDFKDKVYRDEFRRYQDTVTEDLADLDNKKVNQEEFNLYKDEVATQFEQVDEEKLSRDEFETYKTSDATTAAGKVDKGVFETYQEQVATELDDKIGTSQFTTHEQSMTAILADKLNSDVFNSYTQGVTDELAGKVDETTYTQDQAATAQQFTDVKTSIQNTKNDLANTTNLANQKVDRNAFEVYKENISDTLEKMGQSPNEYEWVANEGQLTYVLPTNTFYDPESKWLEVVVGGSTLAPSMVRKDSSSRFTLLVDPADINVGMRVFARWVQPLIMGGGGVGGGAAAIHHSTHYEGGADEIDITKLKGYEQLVKTPNEQEWTTSVNQTNFVITNGTYQMGTKSLSVYLQGVKQSSSDYVEVSSTEFQFIDPLPEGLSVVASWFEGKAPIQFSHGSTHEEGGQDELDVTKLKNYTQEVGGPIEVLNEGLTVQKERGDDLVETTEGLARDIGDRLQLKTQAQGSLVEAVNEAVDLIGPLTDLGSVPRNITKSIAERALNVKDFGAVGDGVSDDWQAIQDAINYVVNGGTLYFPKGIYVISNTLEVPANMSIRGDGRATTVIVWKESELSSKVMLRLAVNTSTQFHTISDIAFNQKRAERNLVDDQSSAAIIPRNNVIIERVKVENTISSAVTSSNGVDNVTIRDCTFFNTGHHPIYFSSSGSTFIKNINIYNNFLGTPADIANRVYPACIIKLRFETAGNILSNINIRNNVTGSPSNSSIAFYLSTTTGASACVFDKVTIADNFINADGSTSKLIETGIYLGDNSLGKDVTISNNVINGNTVGTEGVTTYGIRCLLSATYTSENVKIADNTIKKFSIAVNANMANIHDNYLDFIQYGALLPSKCKFSKNILTSSYDNAIGVYRPDSDVVDNDITLTGATTYGVTLTDTTRRFIVRNKVNNATVGIQRVGGKNLTECVLNENRFNAVATPYQNIDAATQLNNLFEPSYAERVATTATRPTGKYIGERLYDSTLGKPIWWNGSVWKDAAGTAV